jgi:hypothetical protein
MHPLDIQRELNIFGFWFTYWKLRQYKTRSKTLWLIWIAYNIK